MIKRFVLGLSLLCACNSLAAQEIITENGKAYKLHKVAQGEGLYRLSINNNTTQEAIILANPKLKETGLSVGDVIRIPIEGVQIEKLSQRVTEHVVQKGETAYAIAQKYQMRLGDFYQLNPNNITSLPEGAKVRVRIKDTQDPSGFRIHSISAGETLYSIGVRYGVKAQDIISVNPSLNVQQLPIGTAIRIPQTIIPNEDEHYYYHRIAAGETLYALCVKYNLLQDKIVAVNPDIDWQKLSIGQVVAVPKQFNSQVWKTHEVRRRETLYSIVRQYGITEEELRQWNPELAERGLQRDMQLRILDKEASRSEAPATANPHFVGTEYVPATWSSYNYRIAGSPVIRVAVMLPFDAQNELATRRATGRTDESEAYYFKTRPYIEFYEGCRMAADSLCRAGANIELSVFDAQNTLSVANTLSNPDLTNLDLIIGPAHVDRMKLVSDFSQQHKVPVVFPFAALDASLAENPYAFQASVVDTINGRIMIEEMVRSCTGKRLIMIATSNANKMERWREQIVRQMCDSLGINQLCINYNPSNTQPFVDTLSTTLENVLILPTINEAKINSVVTSVANVMDQKPDARVSLLGFGEWLTFQTIEVEVFHKLNTAIYSTFALDYSDPIALRAMDMYRKKYLSEPVAFSPSFQRLKTNSGFSSYSLWGFDVMMQFAGARIALGPDFALHINDHKPHLTQTSFHFEHITNWGGSVNTGFRVMRFGADNKIVMEK